MRMTVCLVPYVLGLLAPLGFVGSAAVAAESPFARQNLVAWCIVPFDSAKRTPQKRAEMLNRLGITRLAYDWRAEHVPSFEDEIVQMRQHGIELFAFWDFHDEFASLVKKHGIHPQFWVTVRAPAEGSQAEKVEAAGRRLLPVAEKARELGCKVGLYNHGGWGGEPENMVAVARWLRDHGQADHVGIVYNLHHGHEHIADFAQVLAAMKPYLLCLNLNGMNDKANPKIVPLGEGQHDLDLLRIIQQSGYDGPIGVLDHRGDVDAEESLRANLTGLKKLLKQLGDKAALQSYE